MIAKYCIEFGNIINGLDFVLNSDIQIRKSNDYLCVIEGKLTFENYILDFLEVIKFVDDKISKNKYKYHFRSNSDEMIFRYDNVPHHPNLSTFPHHKHLGDEVIECSEPGMIQVLAEIKNLLTLNKKVEF